MAKKKKRAPRAARGTGNPCCPIIRIRCSRKYKGKVAAAPTLTERLAKYKKAKAAFRRATGLGHVGPVHPQHEATSMPPKAVVEKIAHAASNPAMRCSVSVGGRTYKGMTGAQAQAKVAELMRAQRAKRCLPKVERG